MSDTAKQMVF